MAAFIFKHVLYNNIHCLDRNLSGCGYPGERLAKSSPAQGCAAMRPEIWTKNAQLSLDIQALGRSAPERAGAERFISEKYKEIHNASLTAFFSTLFAGYAAGAMQVAIGLESLNGKAAFLEQYLEAPVQLSLEKITQARVPRESIVEIGNLASLNMENAQLMVAFLVFYLSRQQTAWAVCTGTAAVRYVLQRMGLHFHVIDKASPAALGDAQKQWGNYYRQKPLVLAVNVADALAVTRESYGCNL